MQVGLHELLGHGTGKLLSELTPGNYNFDISNPPVNPVTKEKISTWYRPGQTWGSVFGGVAASYEECKCLDFILGFGSLTLPLGRAECVAMYLGGDADILEIFGFGENSDIKGEDGVYALYALARHL